MVLAEPYLWAAVLAVGWLILVGWPVAVRDDRPLAATEMGYLRRGERGAIGAAAAALFEMGLAQVTRRGALARSGAPMRAGVEPFAAAVYAGMAGRTGLRALSAKPRVRAAIRALVGNLATAGLVPGRVRWLLARLALVAIVATAIYGLADPDRRPVERIAYAGLLLLGAGAWLVRRRTVAGYRTLRALRRKYAHLGLPSAARPVPAEPGMATAYALGVTTPGMDARYDLGRDWRDAGWFDGGSDGGPDQSWGA